MIDYKRVNEINMTIVQEQNKRLLELLAERKVLREERDLYLGIVQALLMERGS